MILTCNGHNFRYELENLIRLFYPLDKVTVLFDEESDEVPAVLTTLTLQKDYHCTIRVRFKDHEIVKEESVSGDREDWKQECERVFATMLFPILEQETGIRPSWGILTGIRPVKLVTDERKKGKQDDEIIRDFSDRYFVLPSKTKLLLDTSSVEMPVIEDSDQKDFSLYLSIPFCPSRCAYCSFVSHSVEQAKKLIPDYVKTLEEEVKQTGEIAARLGLRLRSVYYGGGTPTTLMPEQLESLFRTVADSFDLSTCEEYTVEAGRADTITKEKLCAIREAGCSRISINPQTFDDEILRRIGRRHTVKEVLDSYALARSLGFDNINMDLIAGLEGDTLEGFERTIRQAIDLHPENITVHTLSVKRSSRLYDDEEAKSRVRDNPTMAMTDLSQRYLEEAGYHPYYLYRQKNTLQNLENVGFCKPGTEGKYNIYIMEEVQTILALGAGAVSKLVDPHSGKIERIFNFKFPYEYIRDFDVLMKRKDRIESFCREFGII